VLVVSGRRPGEGRIVVIKLRYRRRMPAAAGVGHRSVFLEIKAGRPVGVVSIARDNARCR
jgi:hypothetical protein